MKKRITRWAIALIAIFAATLTQPGAAKELTGLTTDSGAKPVLELRVDKVDFRSDLTRVYARLVGRPNTSQRIDGIKLVAGGRTYSATDIDGVDFKRWFQWEAEGAPIEIEIDFGPMKPTGNFIIESATPRGTVRAKVCRRR